ncbi:MAG: hypothetical protein AAF614_27685 [Chloroflexota bacterium]
MEGNNKGFAALRLIKFVGADRAVTFALLGNIVSLLFGPITVLLIANNFSLEIQGYYYTFGSLATIILLAELGLGEAVINFASHEWSSLQFDAEGFLCGTPRALSRLVSLGRLLFQWYFVVALLTVFVICPLGYIFFSRSHLGNDINWLGPWIALCVFQAINITLLPAFYLLQGCNQVTSFWFYRLFQQLFNAFALWFAILAGGNLWTVPFAVAIGLIWSGFFLKKNYCNFIYSLYTNVVTERVNWLVEIWPVQKRMAATWLSKYVASQLFVPILFSASGPVVAGQMGMTMTLVSVLFALSSNWFVTKAPHFGMLVSQKKYKELDKGFVRALLGAFLTGGVGLVGAIGFVVFLGYIEHPLSTRLFPPVVSGLFFLSSLLSSIIMGLSVYLRAHKQEPLVVVAMLASFMTLVSTFISGRYFSVLGVAIAYLAILAIFQLPFSLYIFWNSRAKWHI